MTIQAKAAELSLTLRDLGKPPGPVMSVETARDTIIAWCDGLDTQCECDEKVRDLWRFIASRDTLWGKFDWEAYLFEVRRARGCNDPLKWTTFCEYS